MPRFISLITLTDRGVQEIGDSVNRAKAFQAEVEKAGGAVDAIYWSKGEVDGVVIFQAQDGPTAAALLLKLEREGYVRAHTQRVYNAAEFGSILANT